MLLTAGLVLVYETVLLTYRKRQLSTVLLGSLVMVRTPKLYAGDNVQNTTKAHRQSMI